MTGKAIPAVGQLDWGQPLADHIGQLCAPTGGINRHADFPTPGGIVVEGYTAYIESTRRVMRYTGTIWESIAINPRFIDRIGITGAPEIIFWVIPDAPGAVQGDGSVNNPMRGIKNTINYANTFIGGGPGAVVRIIIQPGYYDEGVISIPPNDKTWILVGWRQDVGQPGAPPPDPNAVIINGGFSIQGCQAQIFNLTIGYSGSGGSGLDSISAYEATVFINQVVFGSNIVPYLSPGGLIGAPRHIALNRSQLYFFNYYITGPAPIHMLGINQSLILPGYASNIGGPGQANAYVYNDPEFSVAFLVLANGSVASITGTNPTAVYTGTARGRAYDVTGLGVFNDTAITLPSGLSAGNIYSGTANEGLLI